MTTVVAARPLRLGVVSFVNTLPLIDGLEHLEGFELVHSVPSLLADALLRGDVDVALCSSIDYQSSPEPLAIIPSGLLGCDGPTLTVRLYSSVPIHKIDRVYGDADSHTSIALVRILLRERWGRDPELIEYDARERMAGRCAIDWPETVLLIGDKVVTDSPPAVRYPHQLDLGEAWREHTGLPFVFATWMTRVGAEPERLATLAAVLDRQRRANALRLDTIIHERAVPRRWPRDLAERYLKELIATEFSEDRLRGLELFFEKAREHGLIERCRPVVFAT